MYSLDSDTVNGILRGHPNIIRHVRAKDQSELLISTIVIEELVGGQIARINSLRSKKQKVGRECEFLARLMNSLSVFPILPYTDEAEALFLSWTPKHRRIGANDCRIAASAILDNLTVVTCNQKDFSAIPGIQPGINLEDWSF